MEDKLNVIVQKLGRLDEQSFWMLGCIILRILPVIPSQPWVSIYQYWLKTKGYLDKEFYESVKMHLEKPSSGSPLHVAILDALDDVRDKDDAMTIAEIILDVEIPERHDEFLSKWREVVKRTGWQQKPDAVVEHIVAKQNIEAAQSVLPENIEAITKR